MAATVALAYAGHNHLRFKITAGSSEADLVGTITHLVLLAAVKAGPLRSIARAKQDGIGTIAAGTALNQAQARALLLADDTTSVGNAKVPRARTTIWARGVTARPVVDAGVDINGNPVIVATLVGAASVAYVDIDMVGGIAQ